ncbi:MAG TPA: PA2169 family four-helix-bundle protein [Caulobacteraceae bacterium]|nr:PA2169 family four-helix-bundle protein [Caulobacteraceae bacterium]
MADAAHHDVHVLNSLIETTIDSVDGYERAAREAKNPEFRRIFEERAFERRRVIDDLRQEVTRMGGEVEDDGSMLAKAHRSFLKIRDAVAGGDDKQVIAEVERGEDFIKNKYEVAMRDDELTMPARETVTRAYDSVKSGHDQMSALKHGLDGDRLH